MERPPLPEIARHGPAPGTENEEEKAPIGSTPRLRGPAVTTETPKISYLASPSTTISRQRASTA
jgi:hypothetical protein